MKIANGEMRKLWRRRRSYGDSRPVMRAFRYRANATQFILDNATDPITVCDTEVFNQLGGTVIDPVTGQFIVPAGYDGYLLHMVSGVQSNLAGPHAIGIQRSVDGGVNWSALSLFRTTGGDTFCASTDVKVAAGDRFRTTVWNNGLGVTLTIENTALTFISGVLTREVS